MPKVNPQQLLTPLAAAIVALATMVVPAQAQVIPPGLYQNAVEAVYRVPSPVPGMLDTRRVDISVVTGQISVTFSLDGRPAYFDEVDNSLIETWQALTFASRQSYLLQVANSIGRAISSPSSAIVVQAGGRYYQCSVYGCNSSYLEYLGLRLANQRVSWYGPTSPAYQVPLNVAADWPVATGTFGMLAPLTLRVLAPADGELVGDAVPVIGTRAGTLRTDQHIWMFAHPDDGSNNWWAHPDELATDTGQWQVTIKMDGPPPGMQSEVVIGVIGEVSRQALLRHLSLHPEQPLLEGLPVDLRQLAHLSLIKSDFVGYANSD
jgi:hypothetical protein